MRHLPHIRKLRQLLGGDARQRDEDLFPLLDGKSDPYPQRIWLPNSLSAARGRTMAVGDRRITNLHAECPAGAPGTTPLIGEGSVTQ
jgi:hypothetical protein